MRRLVIARAGRRCEYCLIHEDDTYFGCEVDHVVSEKGLIAGLLIEVVRTEFAAGIGTLEPREGLAVARWVAPSRDADVGRAGLARAPRPGSPVKPAAGRTENVPTGAANR